MGCCETSTIQNRIDVEDLLSIAQNSLELSKLSSFHIDRIFYRYSTNKKMTFAQFTEACKILDIDLSNNKTKYFFNQFSDKKSKLFRVKSLSTLGVLLGKCSTQEKIKILFQNYDDDSNNRLSCNEISELITDIILICLQYIPSYAEGCFEEVQKDIIFEYKKNLIFMTKPIFNYYISLLFEGFNKEQDCITISWFIRQLEMKRIECILNPRLFRTSVYASYKFASKVASRKVNEAQ